MLASEQRTPVHPSIRGGWLASLVCPGHRPSGTAVKPIGLNGRIMMGFCWVYEVRCVGKLPWIRSSMKKQGRLNECISSPLYPTEPQKVRGRQMKSKTPTALLSFPLLIKFLFTSLFLQTISSPDGQHRAVGWEELARTSVEEEAHDNSSGTSPSPSLILGKAWATVALPSTQFPVVTVQRTPEENSHRQPRNHQLQQKQRNLSCVVRVSHHLHQANWHLKTK